MKNRLVSACLLFIFTAATILNAAPPAFAAEEIFFTHQDHIQSTNIVTNAVGDRAALYEYDPYGSTVTHNGAVDFKHRFTGQEADDSTRLYFYNARYYDPQLGRFLTPDCYVQAPVDPQSFDRYAYGRNNPIRYIDPTGHFWFVAAIVGAVIGALASGMQSGWNPKAMLMGAGIGFLAGAAGGGVGSQFSNAFIGSIVGGAVGGAVAGGLNAAVSGGDVGQGILRGASFGAMGGALFGGIDAGFNKLTQTPGFRWEMAAARIAMEGAAGGALSQLSGGEFWEGVAFSSAIAGSRFIYRVALELSGEVPGDPSLRTSDGTAKSKPNNKTTWGQGSSTSDVGNAVFENTKPKFIQKWFTSETAPMMRALSRFVPGLDPMAEMHDPAMNAVQARIGPGIAFEAINKGTIAPAYGITVLGALHEPAQMAIFTAYGEDE